MLFANFDQLFAEIHRISKLQSFASWLLTKYVVKLQS